MPVIHGRDRVRNGAIRRIIEKELEGFGIRLNKKRPEIMFKKKDKGGMAISVSPGSASAPCPP